MAEVQRLVGAGGRGGQAEERHEDGRPQDEGSGHRDLLFRSFWWLWRPARQRTAAGDPGTVIKSGRQFCRVRAPTAQELAFPDEFVTDMTVIREGRDLFQRQCCHCHGNRAYPGKAPRLRPDRCEPDFVFWAIQGGYGNMPSMGEMFDEEETRKIVAWVKSNIFSH